jgi:hypothetical protein
MEENTEKKQSTILSEEVESPIWVSVSEAAKFGGVQTKTIRRALKNEKLRFKIVKERYQIDFRALILFLRKSKKLKNKLNKIGIGQYIRKWRK